MKNKKVKDVYNRNLGIDRLIALVSVLRDPDLGCPWDISQDHQSISNYCIEEAYELDYAINQEDHDSIKKELGDLLFQVLFHCSIAEKNNRFNFDDVIHSVCDKMIFRHPHVFDQMKEKNPTISVEEVNKNWEKLKKIERNKDCDSSVEDLFKDVPYKLPALLRAIKIQKRAAEVKFDWSETEAILKKITEETEEVSEAIRMKNPKFVAEEIGDLLFSVVNLTRKMNIDPEKSLNYSTNKFINRITSALKLIAKKKLITSELDDKELDVIWASAKRESIKKNE
tara:strand:+ start:130 stop:978 length:849 start_codon:yes stop_codon:yes gene_type:complete